MITPIQTKLLIKRLAAVGTVITVINSRLNNDLCYASAPRPWGVKWDDDWDGFKAKATTPSSSKALKNIILVNQGQYNIDGDKKLTYLGREQARLVSERLNQLHHPYHLKIFASNQDNCIETAQIIANNIVPNCQRIVEPDELLCDGVAVAPSPSFWGLTALEPDDHESLDGPRLEEAFRKYFRRVNYCDPCPSYHIMVCDGTLIRYFVCRALQVPPEAWIRFTLSNCSMTWVTLFADGRVAVQLIGECGYMPQNKITE